MFRLCFAFVAALLFAAACQPALAENGGRGPSGGDFMSSYGPYARPGQPPPHTWEEFYAQQNAANARVLSGASARREQRR